MDPIHPKTTEKLLTLQEASQKLGVTPQTLLSWNDYQILKPTITVSGQIGYTSQQIEQFLHIYEAFRPLQSQTPSLPSSQLTSPFPTSQQLPPLSQSPIPTNPPSDTPHHANHSLRFISTVFTMCIAVTIGIITQQERLNSLLNRFELSYQQTHQTAQNTTSSSNLSMNTPIGVAFSQAERSDDSLQKNTSENNDSAFAQKPENPVTPTQTPSAPATSNKKDGVPAATIAAAMKSLLGAKTTLATQHVIQDVTTFASTITRPTGTVIPNSPFDRSGNIAGAPHTDILAMSYINPDILGSTRSDVLNSSLRNQLILIAIAAAGTLLYVVKRPRKQVAADARVTELSDTSPFSEKVLELDQKMDGTVVLYYNNKAYKVSKPELHSDSDQFIERLMNLYKPGSKEMEYDSVSDDTLKLAAPLSRLVTRLGFVGVKRDIFFPRTAKHSVLFRKYITREDLDAMKIKVDQIIGDLTPLS